MGWFILRPDAVRTSIRNRKDKTEYDAWAPFCHDYVQVAGQTMEFKHYAILYSFMLKENRAH